MLEIGCEINWKYRPISYHTWYFLLFDKRKRTYINCVNVAKEHCIAYMERHFNELSNWTELNTNYSLLLKFRYFPYNDFEQKQSKKQLKPHKTHFYHLLQLIVELVLQISMQLEVLKACLQLFSSEHLDYFQFPYRNDRYYGWFVYEVRPTRKKNNKNTTHNTFSWVDTTDLWQTYISSFNFFDFRWWLLPNNWMPCFSFMLLHWFIYYSQFMVTIKINNFRIHWQHFCK